MKIRNKILIIGPTPPPYNGMSVVTENILKSLLRDKFNLIHLDTVDRRGVSNIGKLDLQNILLAFKHFLRFLQLLIFNKPDIIYVPIAQNIVGFLRDSLFLIPARALNKKVVIHLHGGYFRNFYENTNIFMKVLIRFCLAKAQCAIVLGENLRYIFGEFLPEEKISVVPNGIEDFWKSKQKKWKRNGTQILFLSNLASEKGIFRILEIIPEVVSRFKNTRFIFAGDWFRELEKIRAYKFIEANKLKSFVKFVGVVNGLKKTELFFNSDLLLLPTLYPYEGQPLVILEAMAAGIPVISYNRGAIAETIIDGKNGFLVQPGDKNDLLEKVTELISNPKVKEQIGGKNRKRFLKNYTKERFVSNMKKVFKELLEE